MTQTVPKLQCLRDLDPDRKAALILYLVDASSQSPFSFLDTDVALTKEIQLVESLNSNRACLLIAADLLNELIEAI